MHAFAIGEPKSPTKNSRSSRKKLFWTILKTPLTMSSLNNVNLRKRDSIEDVPSKCLRRLPEQLLSNCFCGTEDHLPNFLIFVNDNSSGSRKSIEHSNKNFYWNRKKCLGLLILDLGFITCVARKQKDYFSHVWVE